MSSDRDRPLPDGDPGGASSAARLHELIEERRSKAQGLRFDGSPHFPYRYPGVVPIADVRAQ